MKKICKILLKKLQTICQTVNADKMLNIKKKLLNWIENLLKWQQSFVWMCVCTGYGVMANRRVHMCVQSSEVLKVIESVCVYVRV